MALVVKVGEALVGVDYILKMFTTFLKQYKIPFNAPFQHSKSMVLFIKQFWWIVFTQFPPYGYYFFT